MEKKSPVTNNIAINNGINNGIIAGTVVVTKEKTEEIVNNFTVKKYTKDTSLIRENESNDALLISPQIGEWKVFFLAYPLEEDAYVKGIINQDIGIALDIRMGQDTIEWKINNVARKFLVHFRTSEQTPITNSHGAIFLYSKKPSILFFGESASKSQFFVTSDYY